MSLYKYFAVAEDLLKYRNWGNKKACRIEFYEASKYYSSIILNTTIQHGIDKTDPLNDPARSDVNKFISKYTFQINVIKRKQDKKVRKTITIFTLLGSFFRIAGLSSGGGWKELQKDFSSIK